MLRSDPNTLHSAGKDSLVKPFVPMVRKFKGNSQVRFEPKMSHLRIELLYDPKEGNLKDILAEISKTSKKLIK